MVVLIIWHDLCDVVKNLSKDRYKSNKINDKYINRYISNLKQELQSIEELQDKIDSVNIHLQPPKFETLLLANFDIFCEIAKFDHKNIKNNAVKDKLKQPEYLKSSDIDDIENDSSYDKSSIIINKICDEYTQNHWWKINSICSYFNKNLYTVLYGIILRELTRRGL